jgi:exopolyphosphatase/guanosine-5'-triphosphate,3'-diphosphate pyrophosphatase
MTVGVVDIGSTTVRLLVASLDGGAVTPLREERAVLGLGEEIERRGRISDLKLDEAAERARAYTRLARKRGCARIAVLVTAPGRQSENGRELVHALERATGLAVRVLTPEEEGRLAFEGAVAQAGELPDRVAVCDVGGGSTEVATGSPAGIERCTSLEIGSLRLTRRFLDDDRPGKKGVAAARREVEQRFADIRVDAEAVLATGGSARALRRVAGTRRPGEKDISAAIKTASKAGAARLAADYGLDELRARTFLAGALVLAEVQRVAGVPLDVARGGVREGAALALASRTAAAA